MHKIQVLKIKIKINWPGKTAKIKKNNHVNSVKFLERLIVRQVECTQCADSKIKSKNSGIFKDLLKRYSSIINKIKRLHNKLFHVS